MGVGEWGGGGGGVTWYITLYTILVQKWGVGAYMVMGAYKVLYSSNSRSSHGSLVTKSSISTETKLTEHAVESLMPPCWKDKVKDHVVMYKYRHTHGQAHPPPLHTGMHTQTHTHTHSLTHTQ